jgi:hypothetical protein
MSGRWLSRRKLTLWTAVKTAAGGSRVMQRWDKEEVPQETVCVAEGDIKARDWLRKYLIGNQKQNV